jgi:hypothetical protein
MLGDPQECRNHAVLCRELASNATDPLARKAYLIVADKWDQLADEIDQAKIVLLALKDGFSLPEMAICVLDSLTHHQ